MHDGKIEHLVGNNSSPIPLRISFHMKNKVTGRSLISIQSIKTFLTVELSQNHKSGSTFFSGEQVDASSDYCQLGNILYLC